MPENIRLLKFAQKIQSAEICPKNGMLKIAVQEMLKMDFADKTLAEGLNIRQSSSPVRAKVCVTNEKA